MWRERATYNRKTSVSIRDGIISEKLKKPFTTQEPHTWRKRTVLIMSDSMLHGNEERRMSQIGLVKVKYFPSSTVANLNNLYMQPLLSKKPSHVIMHVGTNDATSKDSTADCTLDGLFHLNKTIEAKQLNVTVVISTPVRRTDQSSAGKIVEELNKKICSLRLNTVTTTT